MDDNDLDDKKNDEEKIDNLSYKQYVLIILLTLIMILGILFLSLSAVKLLSKSHNMNYNSIIAKLPPVPGDDPGNTDNFIFNYKESENIGNGIFIQNMLPTSDAIGRAFKGEYHTFEFKLLVGKKAINHDFEVTVEKQSISNLNDNYAKIYLEVNGEPCNTIFRTNGKVKVFSELENASIDKNNKNEKIIYKGTVKKRDIATGSINFTLKMWLAEETPMNDNVFYKSFAVKTNIYVK